MFDGGRSRLSGKRLGVIGLKVKTLMQHTSDIAYVLTSLWYHSIHYAKALRCSHFHPTNTCVCTAQGECGSIGTDWAGSRAISMWQNNKALHETRSRGSISVSLLVTLENVWSEEGVSWRGIKAEGLGAGEWRVQKNQKQRRGYVCAPTYAELGHKPFF